MHVHFFLCMYTDLDVESQETPGGDWQPHRDSHPNAEQHHTRAKDGFWSLVFVRVDHLRCSPGTTRCHALFSIFFFNKSDRKERKRVEKIRGIQVRLNFYVRVVGCVCVCARICIFTGFKDDKLADDVDKLTSTVFVRSSHLWKQENERTRDRHTERAHSRY